MASEGTPFRSREIRKERPRKKGKGVLIVLLLLMAAPAALGGWYALQPADKQEQIRAKVPAGWEDRAIKAGACIVALFVMAKVVLPLLHSAVGGLGRALAAMRTRPVWLRVLLFPFELILWLLYAVARLGFIADAILIIGLCVLSLALVARILKADLFTTYLPEILR
jgi:hypothetical protein